MNTPSRLLILPSDPDATPTCVAVDAAGSITARGDADAASTISPEIPDPATRQVLVVPGVACLFVWLDLPTRIRAQAHAVARLLLREHVAGPLDGLHIAIGSPLPDSDMRLVVAVETATLQGWLERAAAAGMQPDRVVPAPLLLPIPGITAPASNQPSRSSGNNGGNEISVVPHDGFLLARGEQLAFAVEASLADAILLDQPSRHLADAEAVFAINALQAPIDLLQQDFARTPSRTEGWHAWRRTMVFAAVLAMSPLLLLGAQAVRRNIDASKMQEHAFTRARTVLPNLSANAAPSVELHRHFAQLQSGGRFAQHLETLLMAVESTPGSELDTLNWADSQLQARLALTGNGQLEKIRAALRQAGLDLVEAGSSTRNGKISSDIVVRAAQ